MRNTNVWKSTYLRQTAFSEWVKPHLLQMNANVPRRVNEVFHWSTGCWCQFRQTRRASFIIIRALWLVDVGIPSLAVWASRHTGTFCASNAGRLYRQEINVPMFFVLKHNVNAITTLKRFNTILSANAAYVFTGRVFKKVRNCQI